MAARSLGRLIPALLVAASVASGTAACVQDDGSSFNPLRELTEVSDDDERELGMEFDRQLQEAVQVIDDPVVTAFINDLGQAIVKQIDPQPYIYRFRVVVDPHLNAFAVPGGYVYFHSETILAAGSIDELAGVMGHEIAHVKAHHYARMQEEQQIPDLLTSIASLAALGGAVATGEEQLIGASQAIKAVNVSLQLRFSRELEREADELGGVFMTRAGYDPAGIARFFERILEEQKQIPDSIPPYLFSHPAVEERIGTVEQAAKTLHSNAEPDPRLGRNFREVQARLARLIETRRTAFPAAVERPDPTLADPFLEEAALRAEGGDVDAALIKLAQAERDAPNDPRVAFRIGELLLRAGRYDSAVKAFRRNVALDPERPLVFLKLGDAYKGAGDRQHAVYAYEFASRLAGSLSMIRRRADWEVEKLTFSVIDQSGFADGFDGKNAETPLGAARESFREDDLQLAWWAKMGPHFVPFADQLTVRWIAPDGRMVRDEAVAQLRKPYVGSVLETVSNGVEPGYWTIEVLLDGDRIERRTVRVDAEPE
jgi:predicted Zn-dependent protease